MPSSFRAALPPPKIIIITPGGDRDVGSPCQSPAAPPFSPITPTWSPITPVFSPITPTMQAQQRDDTNALPDLEPNYYVLRREFRWVSPDGELGIFCASPDGNARNLDGEQYLEEVLEEARVERKYSEDWRKEMGALIEEQGGLLDREPVGIPDQLPQAAVAPPMVAQVAAPVVAPRAPRRTRKRANARGRVTKRKQPKRACKKKINYKE